MADNLSVGMSVEVKTEGTDKLEQASKAAEDLGRSAEEANAAMQALGEGTSSASASIAEGGEAAKQAADSLSELNSAIANSGNSSALGAAADSIKQIGEASASAAQGEKEQSEAAQQIANTAGQATSAINAQTQATKDNTNAEEKNAKSKKDVDLAEARRLKREAAAENLARAKANRQKAEITLAEAQERRLKKLAAAEGKAAHASKSFSDSLASSSGVLSSFGSVLEHVTSVAGAYQKAKDASSKIPWHDTVAKETAEVNTFTNALAESVGGWNAVASAIGEAIDATAQFLQESVELASRLEVLQLHLQYMSDSGQDASAIMDTLTDVSKQTGFGVEQLGGAAQAVVRAGGDVEKSMGKIIALANATGQSVEKTAGAYARALTGNSRALMALARSYGISTSELVAFGAKLTDQGKIAAKTVDDVKALQNALDTLIEARYGDASEKMMETLPGVQRATEASVNRIKSAIGEKLLPFWKQFYTIVYDDIRLLEKITPSLIENIKSAFTPFQTLGDATASVTQKIIALEQAVISLSNPWVLFENAASAAFSKINKEINQAQVEANALVSGLAMRIQRIAKDAKIDLSVFSEDDVEKLQKAGVTYDQITFAIKQVKEALEAAQQVGDKPLISNLEGTLHDLEQTDRAYKAIAAKEAERKRQAKKDADAAEKRRKQEAKEAEKAARDAEKAAVDRAKNLITEKKEAQDERVEKGEISRLEATRETLAYLERIKETDGQIRASEKARAVILNEIKKLRKEENKYQREEVNVRAQEAVKRIEEERQDAVDNRTKTELQAVNDAIKAYKDLLATDKEITDNVKARQKIEAQITIDKKQRRKLERQEAVLHATEQIAQVEKERTDIVQKRGKTEIQALDEAIKRYKEILKTDNKIMAHAEARKKIETQITALTEERKKKEEEIHAMQRQTGESLIQAQRAYDKERERTIDKEMKLVELQAGGKNTATYREKEKAVTIERAKNIEKRFKAQEQEILEEEKLARQREGIHEGTAAYEQAMQRLRNRLHENNINWFNEEIRLFEEVMTKTRFRSSDWNKLKANIQDRREKIQKEELTQAREEWELRMRSQYGADWKSKATKQDWALFETQRQAAEERYKQGQLDVKIQERQQQDAEMQAYKTSSTFSQTMSNASSDVDHLGESASECSIALDGFRKLDLGNVVAAFDKLRDSANSAASALASLPSKIEAMITVQNKVAVNLPPNQTKSDNAQSNGKTVASTFFTGEGV